jgi:hypothetical protein
MSEETPKLNIVLKEQEPVKAKFEGETILVYPHFKLTDKIFYTDVYLIALFNESEIDWATRYFSAEYTLCGEIIKRQTNIDADKLNAEFIKQGLWGAIVQCLPNYDDFRKDLEKVVEWVKFQKQQEKSLGSVIESLVDRLEGIAGQISGMDTGQLVKITEELQKLNNAVPGVLSADSVAKKVGRPKKIQ